MNDPDPAQTTPSRTAADHKSVVVLVTSTQRRGAEVFGESLSEGLRLAGWDSSLMALRDPGYDKRIAADSLFASEEYVDLSGLNLPVVNRLRNHLRETAPDVLFAGGGATLKYSVAALTGLTGGPRLVYSSIGEPAYWARGRISRMILRGLLRRTDMVSAVSQATADQLLNGFGVRPGKLRVAHTGVSPALLDVQDRMSGNELRVLLLGSLSIEKDPLAAIAAFRGMSRPASMRIVGEGPLMDDVRKLATETSGIEVVGAVDDIVPQLAWSDVLVLTSRTEGLPGVILEAAASGVPSVAFGVGGVAEAISNEVSGLVVAPGDIDAMSRSLDTLASDPARLSAMAAAGRQLVREQFLMSTAIDRYAKILEEAIAIR